MLVSVRCVNYRGFADLTVGDLGRVNLVIGRNNCGKSSWIAAAGAVARGEYLGLTFPLRRAPDPPANRARHWRPLFRDGDEERGLSLTGTHADGAVHTLGLRAEAMPTTVGPGAWWYLIEGATAGGPAATRIRYDGEDRVVEHPWPVRVGSVWTGAHSADLSAGDLDALRSLAFDGALEQVAVHLRALDPLIQAVELIGDDVAVALSGIPRRLPLGALGDGVGHLLDVALVLSRPVEFVAGCIDEVDAGLHHSALPQLWSMIRSARPTLQVFATTHRDECVLAAARAFVDAGDDGLRVIRIDRTPDGHRAVSYTAAQARDAIEQGWEVRG